VNRLEILFLICSSRLGSLRLWNAYRGGGHDQGNVASGVACVVAHPPERRRHRIRGRTHRANSIFTCCPCPAQHRKIIYLIAHLFLPWRPHLMVRCGYRSSLIVPNEPPESFSRGALTISRLRVMRGHLGSGPTKH